MALFDLLPDSASILKLAKAPLGSAYDYAKNAIGSSTDTLRNMVNSPAIKEVQAFNGGADISSAMGSSGNMVSGSTTTQKNTSIPDNSTSIEIKKNKDSEYKILYYPQELMANGNLSSRYPHAMGIFINVNSKSKLGALTVGKSPNYGLTGEKVLDLSENTASAGVAQSAGQTTADSNWFNKFLGDNAIIAKFKRFTGCVMLPLPLDINAEYAMSFNEGGAGGAVGTTLKGMVSGGNHHVTMKDAASEVGKAIARDMVKTVGSNVLENTISGAELGKVTNARGMFDKIEGRISNPRTEQMFDKVEFRSWRFSWQINISSVKEWNTVRSIVSLLKENMHPEMNANSEGTFLVVPNEFDIEFYEKQSSNFQESTTLPKIATSALVGLNINYTPMGRWISFEGTMIPPFAMLSLVFKEMEPLHRGMVNTDFSAPDSDFGDKRRGF